MRIQSTLLAVVFFIVVAVAFSWPLLTRLSATGVLDWTEAAATYAAARHTVLLYGQVPLWNPYLCGGYPAIGNPQTYWLSPVFLFVLLFGAVVGPKLAVPIYLVFGLLGMWRLARWLGIPDPAALVAGVVFLTSGFMGMHLAGGQFLWLTLAWVPWVFYGYLRAREHWGWLVFAAACLAMIGLEGRVNGVAYVALMLLSFGLMSDLVATRGRRLRMVGRAGLLLVIAFGLGAWKFIPDLLFLRETVTLPEATHISAIWMLGRLLARSGRVLETYEGVTMVEYGYYVGAIPLGLAIWALFSPAIRARAAAWLFVGAMMLAVTLGGSHNIFELLPVGSALRNPQRAMSACLFVLGLLAAWGASRIRSRPVQWLIITVLIVDLLSVTSPLLDHEYAKVARGDKQPPALHLPFVQDEGFDPYPAVAANRGAKSFCLTVLNAWQRRGDVRAYLAEAYRGEAYVDRGSVVLHTHSPNRIMATVESDAGTQLIINQNWAPGWRAAGGQPTRSASGLLGVEVPAGSHLIDLTFWPPGMTAGMVVTLLTVIILVWTVYYVQKTSR
ncbi:MAG TPA: hypothetical protein VJC05_01310 [Candidatus Andersenbacteria bacterium]|nr:hypothetical protein [Candidatus Andersenbacteria bacterium]